jgi:hypothetical protein
MWSYINVSGSDARGYGIWHARGYSGGPESESSEECRKGTNGMYTSKQLELSMMLN